MIETRHIILTIAVIIILFPVLALAGTINLPKTGQTTSYYSGDDGEIRAGIDWPVPRFTDNQDGTITDNLTGLMWLKDGNCFGAMLWINALNKVADFNANPNSYNCEDYTANYSDWRLPNGNEYESLGNSGEPSVANWLNSAGFVNIVVTNFLWTSTTYACSTSNAWRTHVTHNFAITNDYASNAKHISHYTVWPVRSGQSASPAQLWKTGQTTSYHPLDDGDLQKGVEWPSPRLTDNADGTATDNLTGLEWLKDANCIKTEYPGYDFDYIRDNSGIGDGGVTWQHALDFIKGINEGTYADCGYGYNDWRLPNKKELFSLIDRSQCNPALPSGHPFINVQLDNY